MKFATQISPLLVYNFCTIQEFETVVFRNFGIWVMLFVLCKLSQNKKNKDTQFLNLTRPVQTNFFIFRSVISCPNVDVAFWQFLYFITDYNSPFWGQFHKSFNAGVFLLARKFWLNEIDSWL